MKRIFSGIAAAAVLMTSIAGTSLADTMPQTPFSQPQQRIEQSQMTPPAMPGQQNQGEQSQTTPPAMPGQQNQGEQNQMTPPAMPDQQNQEGQNPTMTVHTENGGRLNMREEPNMDAKVTGRYRNGTQVEILEVGDEWVKVSINGKTGYMMIKFLEGELTSESL